MQTAKIEKAPEGWEATVTAMKNHPEIDNPYSLAGYMASKGYTPHREDGSPRDVAAMVRRAKFDFTKECSDAEPKMESIGLSALGGLARKGAKRESAKPHAISICDVTPLCEVAALADGEAADVVIITEGFGNRADRNYYPREALQNSARAFEGVKCFLDHPSRSDEEDRPERSVSEVCGWFSDCRFTEVNGKGAIVGKLNFTENDAGEDARKLVRSAIRYQKQYPAAEKVLVGFSINAQGPSIDDEVNGEAWNRVQGIESAMSADLVTFPARGGRVLAMREAEMKLASIRWRRQFANLLGAA